LCPGISKIASSTWNGPPPSAMPTLLCSRRKSGPQADGEKPVQSTRGELQAALADFEKMEESRYKDEFKTRAEVLEDEVEEEKTRYPMPMKQFMEHISRLSIVLGCGVGAATQQHLLGGASLDDDESVSASAFRTEPVLPRSHGARAFRAMRRATASDHSTTSVMATMLRSRHESRPEAEVAIGDDDAMPELVPADFLSFSEFTESFFESFSESHDQSSTYSSQHSQGSGESRFARLRSGSLRRRQSPRWSSQSPRDHLHGGD